MLFNSYEFIFVFLPICLLGYYLITKKTSKYWLVFMSFVFYGYWDIKYVPLLLGSIIVNYFLARKVLKSESKARNIWFYSGLAFNLVLLIYFKYSYFIVENVSLFLNKSSTFDKIILPLAISFFTFQQIAYLVDTRKGLISSKPDFIDYSLFISFFPQLIAGPIVHHKEMMPQFVEPESRNLNFDNLSAGLYVFVLGLFKKIAIADTFAEWATKGFDIASSLTFLEAWVTSLSYTFQLYFDFSGYTDMAIGVALMFNIKLPINFNSPYKSENIQEFWRKWHITLSRFLRDYIYIPLGGSKNGEFKTLNNLFLTFLIGGIWHGAGWTFIFWGVLHGLALIFHRLWTKTKIQIPKLLGVLITFCFVNFAWVFFRATSWEDATKVIKGMIGISGIIFPEQVKSVFSFLDNKYVIWHIWYLPNIEGNIWNFVLLLGGFIIVWLFQNTNELKERFSPSLINLILIVVMMVYCLIGLNKISEFLYFQF